MRAGKRAGRRVRAGAEMRPVEEAWQGKLGKETAQAKTGRVGRQGRRNNRALGVNRREGNVTRVDRAKESAGVPVCQSGNRQQQRHGPNGFAHAPPPFPIWESLFIGSYLMRGGGR